MADERPPICSACGVTMVPADLSAWGADGDWVCLECEETGDDPARTPRDGPAADPSRSEQHF